MRNGKWNLKHEFQWSLSVFGSDTRGLGGVLRRVCLTKARTCIEPLETEEQCWVWQYAPVIPAARTWRQGAPWGLLDTQPSLLDKSQASERLWLSQSMNQPTKKVNSPWEMTPEVIPWPLHAHAQMYPTLPKRHTEYTSVILALGKLSQEDLSFEVSLGYLVRFCLKQTAQQMSER